MMSKVIWSAFLLFAFVFPVLSQEPGSSDLQRVPFTTIEQGQTSHVSGGDAASIRAETVIRNLATADAVIRDQETWTRLWESYTQGREPRPELPYVDFNAEMIVISSRGEVLDIYVDRNQGILHVITGDINSSGYIRKTTNTFHIIKTRRSEFQSVVLHHPIVGKARVSDGTDMGDVQMQEEDIQKQEVRLEAVVPSCVDLSERWRDGSWFMQRAHNKCGYTVRMRMIWARAVDGHCYTVLDTEFITEGRLVAYRPYVSELRLC